MQNCNTVRKRATAFIETLIRNGVKELPLQQAKTLFSQIIDVWDRTTIKAYFGTQQHRSTRKISRLARYATGTFSYKCIELTQDTATTSGYLEKLGLAEITQRGKNWFFLVNQDAVIVPQLFKKVVACSSEISLSHPNTIQISARKECEKTTHGVVSPNSSSILETNNNLQSEREKNGYETVYEPIKCKAELKLTPLEKAILKAKPEEAP